MRKDKVIFMVENFVGEPIVSYLLFINIASCFFKANEQEATKKKEILAVYEAASGRMINFNKYEFFFHHNMGQENQQHLRSLMAFVWGLENIWGLPYKIRRSKKFIFKYIKDRVWNRINSRGGKTLSSADREILIKSVMQAIP